MNRLFQQLRQSSSAWVAIALAGCAVGIGVLSLRPVGTNANPAAPSPTPLTVADNQSINALSLHLKKIGAKMYGAYWCPHCKHQKEMFGETSFRNINYIECDPRGENAKPNLCEVAKIKGYPTWEIKGKFYEGTQTFEDLSKASGFKGPSDFRF